MVYDPVVWKLYRNVAGNTPNQFSALGIPDLPGFRPAYNSTSPKIGDKSRRPGRICLLILPARDAAVFSSSGFIVGESESNPYITVYAEAREPLDIMCGFAGTALASNDFRSPAAPVMASPTL